jgi:hypothetical protein
MLKPIEKPVRQSLVHHPSDVLDAYGHYDATNASWVRFDADLSAQLVVLEYHQRQHIRGGSQSLRRSSF